MIAAKDKKFVNKILQDITGINLSEQEVNKLSSYLRFETGNEHLFTYIDKIYSIIGANFKNPGKFIIIPFIDAENRAHLNIQKIS